MENGNATIIFFDLTKDMFLQANSCEGSLQLWVLLGYQGAVFLPLLGTQGNHVMPYMLQHIHVCTSCAAARLGNIIAMCFSTDTM